MLEVLKRENQKGFTVIEVLIGIALFGVVMPSIIVAIVSVGKLNDRSADLTRANIVAEQKLETLRSAGYNTLSDGSVDFVDELDPSFTEPRTATYTVSTPAAGYKEIQIDISYTDQGNSRTISFRSLMSELGVSQ